jgi:penicillin-binding protein-related factor A (putative recombinase)
LVKNAGKLFEEDIQQSAKDQDIFFYRIKDVNPMFLKPNTRVSKNDYDSFIYKKPNLFPIEFKSTKDNKFSFSESIIKAHQIKALQDAVTYDGLIAGFVFNFRENENQTFFVHIDEFTKYKYIAENQIKEHDYISKVNKASISLDICMEIGIEIRNVKKKVRYRYYIGKLLDELISRYGGLDE